MILGVDNIAMRVWLKKPLFKKGCHSINIRKSASPDTGSSRLHGPRESYPVKLSFDEQNGGQAVQIKGIVQQILRGVNTKLK